MEIEAQRELDDDNLVLQGDAVTYEMTYTLNGFKYFDTASLIEIIALVLGAILRETDQIAEYHTSGFTARSVPSISIKDYLYRIAKCSRCTDECFILALIFIDRITERNKKLIIKSVNIHR